MPKRHGVWTALDASWGPLSLLLVMALLLACGSSFSAASDQTDAAVDAPADGAPRGSDGHADANQMDAGTDAADGTGDPDAACTCTDDLSNIGDADFYVAFKITTTSTAQAPVLNQRAECDAAKPFWAVAVLASGQINVETNDGMGSYGQMHSTAAVNDGMPHHVLVSRIGTMVSVDIDGQSTAATVPEASLGALAPLQVGTETSCSAAPLSGSVDSVCLTTACRPP